MRIAIVNDLPLAVEALKRALALKASHQLAWVARNGAEAVEFCAKDTPDLVLMDLLMPVMDGLACAREIRRLERERGQPPIPIIAVTALDQPDLQERCRQAGMDGHVRKPFEAKLLRRMLRRVVAERKRSA